MSIGKLAADLVAKSDDQTVLLGPVVQGVFNGSRQWGFNIVTARKGKTKLFAIQSDSEEPAVAMRNTLWFALIQVRPPCVMHDFDDELAMLRWAEAQWPGAKIAKLRQAVEAEREP